MRPRCTQYCLAACDNTLPAPWLISGCWAQVPRLTAMLRAFQGSASSIDASQMLQQRDQLLRDLQKRPVGGAASREAPFAAHVLGHGRPPGKATRRLLDAFLKGVLCPALQVSFCL